MSLCELWHNFVEAPSTHKAAVRARRDDLLDHLDECPGCRESAPPPASLAEAYAILADEPLDHNQRVSRALSELNATTDKNIEHAMREVLYPALSPGLVQRIQNHDPLLVFQALEGFAMFLRRYTRTRANESMFVTLSAQEVQSPRSGLAPASREMLVREIRVTTGLDPDASGHLFDWIHEGTRELPRFIVGVASTPLDGLHTALLVEARTDEIDLARYWSPSNQQIPDLLAGQLAKLD